ncbi:MAG: DUF1616 domain-containing protein [Candidatus Bathyarchaeota archaeon]|nr:DUF1616 domain-containing protein [Candidatus Bathyarchaeota archaeon]
MNLGDTKLAYTFSCVVLSVVILLPTFTQVISFPVGEQYSELWLLGPHRTAEDYPFNVLEGDSYKIYLGVSNHIGGSAYYRLFVKLRNASEPLPNGTSWTPSPIEAIYRYDLFLGDNKTWESELSFSFKNVSFDKDVCWVSRILIGGYGVNLDKTAVWNETESVFFYQLFFELWLYDAASSSFAFHNRWIGLPLNVSMSL